MAATQYLITTYEALRTILQGHAPFWSNVRSANFIDWTTPKAKVKRYAITTRAPADYGEIDLMIGPTASDPMTTATAHYGDDAADASWLETPTHTFVLRMTFDIGTYALPQLMEQEALTALRKAGSKIGLNEVFSWGPIAISRRDVDANGNKAQVIEFSIPVQYRFDSAALTV